MLALFGRKPTIIRGLDSGAHAHGIEGFALATTLRPDLVILDLNMPGMNGAQFIRKLRSEENLNAVRVVFYTATSPNAAMRALMEISSVDHIIPKPSEPQDILKIVEEALRVNST